METEQGRSLLLVGLPDSLRGRINNSGPPRQALETMVDALVKLDQLADGTLALSVCLEAAVALVPESAPARKIKSILESLSDQAFLRDHYMAYLVATRGYLDLRRYVPLKEEDVTSPRLALKDIYADTWVTREKKTTGQASPSIDEHVLLQEALDQKNIDKKLPVVLLSDYVSTLEQHVAYYALSFLASAEQDGQVDAEQRKDALPILVSLERYAEALKHQPALSVPDFAAAYYYEKRKQTDWVRVAPLPDLTLLFAAAHKDERAIYILEGLENVPAAERTAVSLMIGTLADSLKGTSNRLLITSQRTGYITLPLPEHYEAVTEPGTALQRIAYVQRFYRAWRKLRSHATDKPLDTVIRELEQPEVARLADNALMVTLLLLLALLNDEALPNACLTLYERIATLRIDAWLRARWEAGLMSSRYTTTTARRQLSELAFWIHDQPSGQVRREDLEAWLVRWEMEFQSSSHKVNKRQSANEAQQPPLAAVPKEAAAAKRVQRTVERKKEELGSRMASFMSQLDTGKNMLEARSNGYWNFSHITAQEYFAALYLAHYAAGKRRAAIIQRAPDPRWTNVICLVPAAIGDQEQTTVLCEAILNRHDPYEPVLRRNLLLAGRVLGDEPPPDPETGGPPTNTLIKQSTAEQIARQLFDLLRLTESRALIDQCQAALTRLQHTWLWPRLVEWAQTELDACRAVAEAAAGGVTAAPQEATVRAARRLERLGIFIREPGIWNGFLELLLDFQAPLPLRRAAKAGLDRWLLADASFSGMARGRIVEAMQSLVAEEPAQWGQAAALLIQLLGQNSDLTRAVILPMLLKTNNTELMNRIILPYLRDDALTEEQLLEAAQALRPIAADHDVLPAVYELLRPDRSDRVRKAAVAALMDMNITRLTAEEKAALLKQMEELLVHSAFADEVSATVARWAAAERA